MSLALAENVEDIKAKKQGTYRRSSEGLSGQDTKRRAKHLGTFQEGKPDCGVKSNIKSIPGVMTIRGCAYAGSRRGLGFDQRYGTISHRPVGLRTVFLGLAPQLLHRYDWRRYLRHDAIHLGLPEKDIVFGGDKKLAKVMDEIQTCFRSTKASRFSLNYHRHHRRRYRGSLEVQVEGVWRQDHRAGALRRLPRRVAVAWPPPRQRRSARHGVR